MPYNENIKNSQTKLQWPNLCYLMIWEIKTKIKVKLQESQELRELQDTNTTQTEKTPSLDSGIFNILQRCYNCHKSVSTKWGSEHQCCRLLPWAVTTLFSLKGLLTSVSKFKTLSQSSSNWTGSWPSLILRLILYFAFMLLCEKSSIFFVSFLSSKSHILVYFLLCVFNVILFHIEM